MPAFGGVKRTTLFALQMSAFDPKRTKRRPFLLDPLQADTKPVGLLG
jgi:hypothetical protein